jgi:ketosteroid isomerase-like protein
MSQKLELVRRAYARWAEAEFLPAELWADDLEWHPSPADPDTTDVLHGREAVEAVLHRWLDLLGPYDMECDFIEAEDEVLVSNRFLLRGTHAPLLSYHACRVAGGKIEVVHVYDDRRAAFSAMGLEE